MTPKTVYQSNCYRAGATWTLPELLRVRHNSHCRDRQTHRREYWEDVTVQWLTILLVLSQRNYWRTESTDNAWSTETSLLQTRDVCYTVRRASVSTDQCRTTDQLCLRRGSRTLRPQDTSAPRHFCTTKLVPKFKTNHWCSLIGIVLGRSVPAFPRSRHSRRSVSCHVFGVEVSWDRCRSVPECLDAEVSCGRSVR